MKIKLEVEQQIAVMFIKMIQHIDPTNFVFSEVLKDIDNQIADQIEAEKAEKAKEKEVKG